MEEYYIGQIFDGEYPQGAADFCNETQTAMIKEIDPVIIDDQYVRRFQIVEIPQQPAPTEEEQRQARAVAYREEVDPVTAHIERLKDEEQTEEIEQKINELKAERTVLVEDIKKRYPYPEEDNEKEDSDGGPADPAV